MQYFACDWGIKIVWFVSACGPIAIGITHH